MAHATPVVTAGGSMSNKPDSPEADAAEPRPGDHPSEVRYRPLKRFWPYVELPEQPTDEELAALDPDLHEALFGRTDRPFSITLVFPRFEGPLFERVLELSRGGAECREVGSGEAARVRARFLPSDARRLHQVFEIVGPLRETEVLIDDRPVPYARELWLPLVWFLLTD